MITPDYKATAWLDAILTDSAKLALLRIMGNKAKKERLLTVMLIRAYWAGYEAADHPRPSPLSLLSGKVTPIPDKARQLRNPPI